MWFGRQRPENHARVRKVQTVAQLRRCILLFNEYFKVPWLPCWRRRAVAPATVTVTHDLRVRQVQTRLTRATRTRNKSRADIRRHKTKPSPARRADSGDPRQGGPGTRGSRRRRPLPKTRPGLTQATRNRADSGNQRKGHATAWLQVGRWLRP